MAPSPYIEELRLTSFKSFRDAVLPLRDLTLLIGRTGSGKSNAIDALHVLDRLAEGEELREAIDGGRREGSEVRGGVAGCASFGRDTFELGCTVVNGEDRLKLDVEIQVQPDVADRPRAARPEVRRRQGEERLPANLKATREIHQAAVVVIEALRSIFVLDPVPHRRGDLAAWRCDAGPPGAVRRSRASRLGPGHERRDASVPGLCRRAA